MMAVRLRVPIVPIRLQGLYEIYSVHDSWPRRGPIHVSIGRPLSFPADTRYEDAAHRLEEVLKNLPMRDRSLFFAKCFVLKHFGEKK